MDRQGALPGRFFIAKSYSCIRIFNLMKLVQIYQCLCDETRLRLLNLLLQGPLCVCHFQRALDEPQVKISKHLGYLRTRGLVKATRRGNWMIYELPPLAVRSPELSANLACLQDCTAGRAVFRRDLARLEKVDLNCGPVAGLSLAARGVCGCDRHTALPKT